MIMASVTLTVIACSRKMTPAATQTQPAPGAVTTATDNNAMIEAGKALYDSRCGTCHGLKKVERFSVTEWEHIMRSMAPKAKLTEAETQQVTAYVNANAKK